VVREKLIAIRSMGRDDLTYGIFRGRMTEDGLVVMPSKAADEE